MEEMKLLLSDKQKWIKKYYNKFEVEKKQNFTSEYGQAPVDPNEPTVKQEPDELVDVETDFEPEMFKGMDFQHTNEMQNMDIQVVKVDVEEGNWLDTVNQSADTTLADPLFINRDEENKDQNSLPANFEWDIVKINKELCMATNDVTDPKLNGTLYDERMQYQSNHASKVDGIKEENTSIEKIPEQLNLTLKRNEETSFPNQLQYRYFFRCKCGNLLLTKKLIIPHCKDKNESAHYILCGKCGRMVIENPIIGKSPRKKLFCCNHCDKKFAYQSLLQIHLKMHNKNRFSCPNCKKTFEYKAAFNTHAAVCAGKRLLYCVLCDTTFIRKFQFNRHLKTHDREMQLQCDKDEIQKSKSNQSSSMQSREGLLQCYYCGNTFNKRSELLPHLMNHSEQKPFQCTKCDKTFSVKHALNRHLRIHTGKKPFQCAQCDKAFGRQSHLDRHSRSHKGERPFECNDCGRLFLRKTHIIVHLQSHARKNSVRYKKERPFECDCCNKRFLRKFHLITHLRKNNKYSKTSLSALQGTEAKVLLELERV